jgi:FkbM family methyltransferase
MQNLLKRSLKNVYFNIAIRIGFDKIVSSAAQRNPGLRKYIPLPRYYKASASRSAVRDGVRFKLSPADYMQWSLFAGEKDKFKEALLLHIQGRGDGDMHILDIGANCGHFCLAVAKLLYDKKAGGEIIAFEPNPRVMEMLTRNLSLNPQFNKMVKTIPFAVGEKSDTLEISVPLRNTGAGSLCRNYDGEPNERYTVQVVSVDDFIVQNSIGRVDFMKIDVESFEPLVLRGAQKTIDQFHPSIYIEFINNSKEGYDDNYIYNFISDNGYTIYRETPEGFSLLKGFADIKDVPFCNLLAIHIRS